MIVYTGGTFDLLHVGHIELLDACRVLAGPTGRVVVALNTDDFVTAYKGRPPVQDYATRAEMLRSLRQVDLVVANAGGADSTVAIGVIRPDVLAIGSDWQDRDYMAQLGITAEWMDAQEWIDPMQGLPVEYVPRTRGVSTTSLRERVA